ncbi:MULTISPECIES: DUF6338 family protein, partial [unclassified Roseovarius]|uniref:DUF6338 family protein n=1 Tax=unclassified Roseovarius TaxID=2614913 RepID=UPI00273FC797
ISTSFVRPFVGRTLHKNGGDSGAQVTIEHPIRKAYDYAFTHDRPPGFVILTFQDGVEIYGYFGPESLAANDPARSDIYLERLYDIDEDGQWSEKNIGRSAVISLEGIRSIEFLDPEGEQDA